MESKVKFKPNPEYDLMGQIREVLRYYHYAYRTEQSYCSWISQYIKFYGGKTHPKDMGKIEVERFLSYLSETPKGKRTASSIYMNPSVADYKNKLMRLSRCIKRIY